MSIGIMIEDFKNKYSLVEKIGMCVPIIICLFNIPINFFPTDLIPVREQESKVISSRLLQDFNRGNVLEITMTNTHNYLTGECYSKQTLTKIDSGTKKTRTYTYWTRYCTGRGDWLYDFKLVNDGGKRLKLHSFSIPDDFVEQVESSDWAFTLNVAKPLKYFSK